MATTGFDMTELGKTDLSAWASSQHMSGLKEARDQKEMLFLGQLLTELGSKRFGRLADCIAQRMRELKSAKGDGSNWEKAAVVSLMSQPLSSNAPMLDNAFII